MIDYAPQLLDTVSNMLGDVDYGNTEAAAVASTTNSKE